jgi:hypothetical protein
MALVSQPLRGRSTAVTWAYARPPDGRPQSNIHNVKQHGHPTEVALPERPGTVKT